MCKICYEIIEQHGCIFSETHTQTPSPLTEGITQHTSACDVLMVLSNSIEMCNTCADEECEYCYLGYWGILKDDWSLDYAAYQSLINNPTWVLCGSDDLDIDLDCVNNECEGKIVGCHLQNKYN